MIKQKLQLGLKALKFYRNPISVFSLYFGLQKHAIVKTERNKLLYVAGNSSDLQIANEIFLNKIYDKAIRKCPAAPVILDIGSNIGVFSIRCLELCDKPRIFAFEPFERNFKMLSKNVALNKAQSIITPVNEAVFGKNNQEFLNVKSGSEGGSSFYSDATVKADFQVKVKTTSLDNFVGREKLGFIDLLKLDCEGAEFDILYNSPKALRVTRRIVMEYHEYFGTGKAEELKEFLEKSGFTVSLKYTGPLGMMYAERV